jgi:heme O synthase-like polyprenyltransferase
MLGAVILVLALLFLAAAWYWVQAIIHTILWLIVTILGFKKQGDDVVWSSDGLKTFVLGIVFFFFVIIMHNLNP